MGDNYFTALNSAVFSDGSFVYIPKGVHCPMELSTYFRINASETGQVRLRCIGTRPQRPLCVDDAVFDLMQFMCVVGKCTKMLMKCNLGVLQICLSYAGCTVFVCVAV